LKDGSDGFSAGVLEKLNLFSKDLAVEGFFDYDMTFRIYPEEIIKELENDVDKKKSFVDKTQDMVTKFVDKKSFESSYKKYYNLLEGDFTQL